MSANHNANECGENEKQETPALASMARDDSPAARRPLAARRPMRGKVGWEFET